MDFVLPDLGEGVQEGELMNWLVKNGDKVEQDQPLLEVMTDKATVEIPAPNDGVIDGIKTTEGDILKVGQVLGSIGSSGASKTAATSTPPPPTPPAKEAPSQTVQAAAPKSKDWFNSVVENKEQESYAKNTNDTFKASDTVVAAPLVRVMAQKEGVDLNAVKGTGPAVGGVKRVLEKDLINFLNSSSSSSQAAPVMAAVAAPVAAQAVQALPTRSLVQGEEKEERVPLRGLRRVISQAMVKSKFTIPHYSYVDEFECSSFVEMRLQAKKLAATYGVKMTYLPFIVKALVGALREFPEANSSLVDLGDGKMELVKKSYYHIGFAVSTKDGLLVPVIKHADKKTLLEIAVEMAELSQKARDGKATKDELSGSTFTITSMGNIGGLFATPIINYPESGILGVYKVRDVPVVKDDQVVPGKMMTLSLSLDHRVIDGAVGGHFCNALIKRLQNPAQLLMEMV